jgi:hypothetical protein
MYRRGLVAVMLIAAAVLSGCRNDVSDTDNSDYVVSEVYGTYVVCVSAASKDFQVPIEPGTTVAVGDECPEGEHR